MNPYGYITTQGGQVQDMSVCVASDSDDEGLIEITKCTKCTFEAPTEGELERHLEDVHSKLTINTLDEDTVPSDRIKPIPLYKCNECAFAATTTEALKEHRKTEHSTISSKKQDEASGFNHSCISCQFKTNDYNGLMKHIESSHGNKQAELNQDKDIQQKPIETQVVTCLHCNLESKNLDEMKIHLRNIHMNNEGKTNSAVDVQSKEMEISAICSQCDFNGNNTELKEHVESSHGRKYNCVETVSKLKKG